MVICLHAILAYKVLHNLKTESWTHLATGYSLTLLSLLLNKLNDLLGNKLIRTLR